MFESALIGPQLVSPSTRRPTSISGSDSDDRRRRVIQTGMIEHDVLDDDERDRARGRPPMPTHFSGNSSDFDRRRG